MSTSVILGAGFSYVAGLPLAKDLLDSDVFIFSNAAEQRYEQVINAYRQWRSANPESGAEQFLLYVYSNPLDSGVPWKWVVELVAATLASPRGDDIPAVRNRRYAGQITKPFNNLAHEKFLDVLFRYGNISSVLSFNYDVLAERGIRHRELVRKPRPGFFYGGLERPQICLGNQSPFSVQKPERKVELSGGLPLYKLHGSLNWAMNDRKIEMYTDMRPAFRRGGEALIVPPLPEKIAPDWLSSVWSDAQSSLESSECWLVCGYSLPSYDYAAHELFIRSALKGVVRQIIILDPASSNLEIIWRSICPNAVITALPGIPDALAKLREILTTKKELEGKS